MAKLKVEKIKAEVRRMDPKLDENDDGFKTAVILLSSAIKGTNADDLASFTGYSRDFVRSRAGNFRKNGIWENGKVRADWSGKDGGCAFWLDVCCGDGLMERCPAKS
jgi:hypothetical protein